MFPDSKNVFWEWFDRTDCSVFAKETYCARNCEDEVLLAQESFTLVQIENGNFPPDFMFVAALYK